jgi:hypothetical protein
MLLSVVQKQYRCFEMRFFELITCKIFLQNVFQSCLRKVLEVRLEDNYFPN